MRWLQAAVVMMSIMIVAGVTVIGVTIAHRLSGHAVAPLAHETGTPIQSVLKLPSGAHVLGVSGGESHLVVRVEAQDQTESLYVVDPDTGRLTHQIMLDNR